MFNSFQNRASYDRQTYRLYPKFIWEYCDVYVIIDITMESSFDSHIFQNSAFVLQLKVLLQSIYCITLSFASF